MEIPGDSVQEQFRLLYDRDCSLVVFSPGRINLIGEHTDYNEGYVFPAAVNLGIYLAVAKTEDNTCCVRAQDLGEDLSFDPNESLTKQDSGWGNYILGVVHHLKREGVLVGGFRALFAGTIPKGAGMSSSAALENAFAYGLNYLFGGELPPVTLAKIGQRAEHDFVGVQCGIMDQFSSMLGKEGHALLLDCRTLFFEYVPVHFGDYRLLLINSNVHHNLASSEYNVRRNQVEESLACIRKQFPKVHSLREVTDEMLQASKVHLSDTLYRRCKYVIEENQRVLAFVEHMRSSQSQEAGELLSQSQKGMREEYEITCSEVDFIADFCNTNEGVAGARMMGGGFGGCVIALVEGKWLERLRSALGPAYEAQFGHSITFIDVQVAAGTRVLED